MLTGQNLGLVSITGHRYRHIAAMLHFIVGCRQYAMHRVVGTSLMV